MGGFFRKIGAGLRQFMQGRYGSDKLNTLILTVGLIATFLQFFIPILPVKWFLMIFSYVCMFVAIFRMLSRNTYKRYKENSWYLRFLNRIKDKEHRYYKCPYCKQSVRVPRGKGKISIHCPKCTMKFIKKT